MSHPALKKIQDINIKITQLEEEKTKLKTHLEQTILHMLHKNNAFNYDYDTLVSGVAYVIKNLKGQDDHSKKICASWKSLEQPIRSSNSQK